MLENEILIISQFISDIKEKREISSDNLREILHIAKNCEVKTLVRLGFEENIVGYFYSPKISIENKKIIWEYKDISVDFQESTTIVKKSESSQYKEEDTGDTIYFKGDGTYDYRTDRLFQSQKGTIGDDFHRHLISEYDVPDPEEHEKFIHEIKSSELVDDNEYEIISRGEFNISLEFFIKHKIRITIN